MRSTALLALLTLAVVAPATAGVRVRLETRQAGATNRSVESSELLLGARQVRMTRLSGGPQTGEGMLFDADRETLWVLDPGRRSYHAMDRSQAKATGGQLESAMSQVQAQMADQLKSLPPEQRAMVERAMKGRMPQAMQAAPAGPPRRIQLTGDRAEKQGHPCRRVEVWSGDELQTEHWVTDWAELGLVPGDFAVLEELGEFMTEISASLGGRGSMPQLMQATDEMGGVPVVTIRHAEGRGRSETLIVSVEKADIPAGELSLPEGYTESKMPGFPAR